MSTSSSDNQNDSEKFNTFCTHNTDDNFSTPDNSYYRKNISFPTDPTPCVCIVTDNLDNFLQSENAHEISVNQSNNDSLTNGFSYKTDSMQTSQFSIENEKIVNKENILTLSQRQMSNNHTPSILKKIDSPLTNSSQRKNLHVHFDSEDLDEFELSGQKKTSTPKVIFFLII